MAYRYKTIKVHGKTKLLHRHLTEQRLGRVLLSEEHVHHKNGDRYDNSPENLEVLPGADHIKEHKQKYPLTKTCVMCGVEFEPHQTKRKRSLACGTECGRRLLWVVRKGEEVPFPSACPQVAEALITANARAA